ncbi:putative late blight resistance protein homolog R1A-10 [Bidens hawaiensis]|uniref:putative late blight resistance protein homolog R1A-10 n=1 Tax=Bidens hawaiensis TaxID=980011 RepID=UPI0040498448
MFISSAVINNDDSLSPSFEDRTAPSTGTYGLLYCDSDSDSDKLISPLMPDPVVEDNLLDCSLTNLKHVMDDLKSVREEIMISNNKGNLFQKHLNPQDMMMDKKIHESAAGTTCSTGNTSATTLSAMAHEELIVGFEDDALLILDRLTGDRKKLDIISIVGMGGQGKTTLATKIFNDSLVKYRFSKRGWITVSQAYSKRDLLLQLLMSLGKSVHESVTESKLCEILYQSLKGRRYLIVIDDIWSCKAWDDVGLCFPDDKTANRVLITTRLTEVALHISQGGFTHSLPHLNDDQSWELLCKKTFRGHECPESLTETGKNIAKKCGGLPLALVVIAGLLEKGEKSKDLWDKIAKSVGSCIIKDPKGCMDTLALSYDHLPCHLKKCFLYVGGFPEDYKVQVRTLIRLWMAEEFIKEAGQRSLQEEGEHHLMDLIDRNLLIVADKSYNGGIKSCRLHDLLRELCLKKSCEENFFKKMSISDSTSSMVEQRRLFIDYEALCKFNSNGFTTHTRSVLCLHNNHLFNNIIESWVHSLWFLRVLDLLNIPMHDLGEITVLVHLRYLAVWLRSIQSSFSEVGKLPFSKAKYGSLQTLIVKGKFESKAFAV